MTDWDFSCRALPIISFLTSAPLLPIKSKYFQLYYFQLYVQTFMGFSEMNPTVLRKLAGVVDRPFCIIFEKSQQLKYPVTGKREISHQFSKRIKKEDHKNYQVVSLTSVFGKIMEEFLLGTMSRHMNGRKVISDSQHSFRTRICINPLNYLLAFYNEVME